MRATLTIEEKRSFLSLGWTVDCRIEFTELELAAIQHGRLGAEVICYQGRGESQRDITLGEIMRDGGMRTTFPTLQGARKDYAFIEDSLLPKIKSVINSTARVGGEPKIIEY